MKNCLRLSFCRMEASSQDRGVASSELSMDCDTPWYLPHLKSQKLHGPRHRRKGWLQDLILSFVSSEEAHVLGYNR
jgi:hypothetical protein